MYLNNINSKHKNYYTQLKSEILNTNGGMMKKGINKNYSSPIEKSMIVW